MKTRISIIAFIFLLFSAVFWIGYSGSDPSRPGHGHVVSIKKWFGVTGSVPESPVGKSKRDRNVPQKSGYKGNYYTDRLFSKDEGILAPLFEDASTSLEPQEVSNLVIQLIRSNERPPSNDLMIRLIERYSLEKSGAYSAVIGKLSGDPDSLLDLVEKMPSSPAKSKGYQRYFFEVIRDKSSLENSLRMISTIDGKDMREGAIRGVRQAVQLLISNNQITKETAKATINENNSQDELFAELLKEIDTFNPPKP